MRNSDLRGKTKSAFMPQVGKIQDRNNDQRPNRKIAGSEKGMSVRAGAAGRSLVWEGIQSTIAWQSVSAWEVGRQGECFREQGPEIGVYDGTDHREKLE